MHRVHKIKLDPTQEQAIYFARACGVARFAFNWALAAWKEEYEAGGKPNEAALRKRLNAIKAEQFPWMAEVTKVAPQNAIKNVGVAFKHFFRRVKQGGKPGYPRFKRKGVRDSFCADNGPVNVSSHAVECSGKTVKLPKCGVVRMREPLRFAGRTLAATVSKQAGGYVALATVRATTMRTPLHLASAFADGQFAIVLFEPLRDRRRHWAEISRRQGLEGGDHSLQNIDHD